MKYETTSGDSGKQEKPPFELTEEEKAALGVGGAFASTYEKKVVPPNHKTPPFEPEPPAPKSRQQ